MNDYVKNTDPSRSPAVVRNVKTELESLAHTLSPNAVEANKSGWDDLKSVVSELISADRRSMGKTIRLIMSHMKVTHTVICNINTTTRENVQNIPVPATIDNGADTLMFSSDFLIFE